MTDDVRPDRHILLELAALLDEVIRLRDSGDRARFDSDHEYRWLLHRIWIAIGNEAFAYAALTGRSRDRDSPWSASTSCATDSLTAGFLTLTRTKCGG